MGEKKPPDLKPWLVALVLFCILPNVIFWLISPRVYLVRGIFVLEYFFIGSLFPFISRKIFYSLWIIFALYDLLFATSSLFFMDFFEILHALSHIPYISFMDVLKWSGIVLLFVLITSVLLWVLIKINTSISFLKPRYVIPAALLVLFFDFLNAGGPLRTGSFRLLYLQSNIVSTPSWSFIMSIKYAYSKTKAGSGSGGIIHMGSISKEIFENSSADSSMERKQLMVLVESWGLLNNKELHREVIQPFYDLAQKNHYKVKEGVTTYKFLTQAAELKEITGYIMPFSLAKDSFAKQNSIFFKKQEQGYYVIGLHGYSSAFYERKNWWPALGIQEAYFADKLKSLGMPLCGNQFFRGVCDTSISSWIFSYANLNPVRKDFFYWVTLNTHLPLENKNNIGFRPFYQRWKKSKIDIEILQLCFELRALFSHIAQKAGDPLSPRIHILLVGDHAPPLLEPASRNLFSATEVPYIELIPVK